jgi:hypothetical protein
MSKRIFQTMLALSLLLLGMVACAPESELSLPAEGDANTTAGEPPDAMNTAATTETTTVGETALETTTQDNPTQDMIVDVTPMSEEELANQPPGTAPGGAGGSEPGGGSDSYPGTVDEAVINREAWPAYTDSTYNFTVGHPADFVVRPLDSAKLAELTPAPSAVIRFMSPGIANSAVGDLDIPELNLQLYPAPQGESLESWMAANGLMPEGDMVEPYQNAAVTGVKVCLNTLLAPNCSIFVMGNSWVYRLTPLGPVGEAMVESFALTP